MKESVIIEQIRRRLGIESLNDMQTTMAAKANASNVVLLSPTGSGKTIILIGFVDEYLNKVNSNTAIVWPWSGASYRGRIPPPSSPPLPGHTYQSRARQKSGASSESPDRWCRTPEHLTYRRL